MLSLPPAIMAFVGEFPLYLHLECRRTTTVPRLESMIPVKTFVALGKMLPLGTLPNTSLRSHRCPQGRAHVIFGAVPTQSLQVYISLREDTRMGSSVYSIGGMRRNLLLSRNFLHVVQLEVQSIILSLLISVRRVVIQTALFMGLSHLARRKSISWT
ncbi:hypothetical protein BDP27DRAFT_143488 [Rhodocollybia butyracea]|uniref:Uncharacterized protein n=1 Tax=Rhodocollybia butyracea TaxID=206335 RepID=A0A9P5UCZ4_9AGAR|nr:hypothetical protein BDP27DRAFT_143488 [Rhodocollybia butyracea]